MAKVKEVDFGKLAITTLKNQAGHKPGGSSVANLFKGTPLERLKQAMLAKYELAVGGIRKKIQEKVNEITEVRNFLAKCDADIAAAQKLVEETSLQAHQKQKEIDRLLREKESLDKKARDAAADREFILRKKAERSGRQLEIQREIDDLERALLAEEIEVKDAVHTHPKLILGVQFDEYEKNWPYLTTRQARSRSFFTMHEASNTFIALLPAPARRYEELQAGATGQGYDHLGRWLFSFISEMATDPKGVETKILKWCSCPKDHDLALLIIKTTPEKIALHQQRFFGAVLLEEGDPRPAGIEECHFVLEAAEPIFGDYLYAAANR